MFIILCLYTTTRDLKLNNKDVIALQPYSFYLRVFAKTWHLGKAALSNGNQVTDLVIESYFTSLPSKSIELLSQYIQSHYPSALANLLCTNLQKADSIALNTSEFILLLLSANTSSVSNGEPPPLVAIHVCAITLPPSCLTCGVVCF